MNWARRLLIGLAAPAAVLVWPAPASAHPLGNFTVNVYDGITLIPGTVRIVHVVDMAEIPTFQVLRQLDDDGSPSDEAVAAWTGRAARDELRQLAVTVDGRRVALRLEAASAQLRPGQGGLPTLRKQAVYSGSLPRSGALAFQDGTFPGRLGWREVTATGKNGVAVDASVPAISISDALRFYPQDMLSSPPRVIRATVSFRPGVAEAGNAGTLAGEQPSGVPSNVNTRGFAGLASRGPLTPALVALALVLALGFGALHAVGPGHGKTLMAAYLIGGEGRVRHAIQAAGAVAAMHTASVVGLGIVVLSAERAFLVERIYPRLGLTSGLVAMALGVWLLVSRLRRRNQEGHEHAHAHSIERPLSRRGLAALALSGGLLPSPTAIVALLAAIALGRIAFGLAIVGAFSLGLAGTLSLVGVLAIRARAQISTRLGRWGWLLPLGSASAIAALGAVIVARAALQL